MSKKSIRAILGFCIICSLAAGTMVSGCIAPNNEAHLTDGNLLFSDDFDRADQPLSDSDDWGLVDDV